MTRRSFIKKLASGFKALATAALLPHTFFLNQSFASNKNRLIYAPETGITLKKISLEKLHHGKRRFLNPFTNIRPWSFWRFIKWMLKKNRFKKSYKEEKIIPVSFDWNPVMQHKGISVTFLKHACVMIKDIDKYILVDPIFFGLGGTFKDYTPITSDIKDMPKPDILLITHGHYDHLDKQSLACIDRGTSIITPLGHDGVFKDMNMNNRTKLDWFDTFSENNMEITLIPCNHWTMRNPLIGPNRSLWGSFLIKTASGVNIFIAGDTGYFDGFEELGKEFDIDLAIFNLGAYEPRWFMAQSHMNPAETVRAFKALKAKNLMVVHWGTFRLGEEPVHFPHLQIRTELSKQGLLDSFKDIEHGQTLFL
jgi:N-acyl-phosphatidylethanolamine-hydrolysing phospholipase D